ncbi:hypothetical protein ES703_124770 [subsurface metagenome]
MTVVFDDSLHAGNGAGLDRHCEMRIADPHDNDEQDERHHDHTGQDEPSHCCIAIFFHNIFPGIFRMSGNCYLFLLAILAGRFRFPFTRERLRFAQCICQIETQPLCQTKEQREARITLLKY